MLVSDRKVFDDVTKYLNQKFDKYVFASPLEKVGDKWTYKALKLCHIQLTLAF